MNLASIGNEDQLFLYLERYVDEGAKTYSSFSARSEVPAAYQPAGGRSDFELITILAPKDRVSICEAEPAGGLRELFVRPEGVLFAVHPDTWATPGIDFMDELHALPRGRPIRAAPTASTRTVLALDHPAGVPPHFLKLHLPRRVSRFNRRLRRKNIHNSVAVSRDVAGIRGERFAYLPDCLGFAYGEGGDAWGFLVREKTPRPAVEPRLLIPCFALFARDLKRPGDPPLIAQLIDRLGADPQAFIVDEIMIPVVECWAKAARERGILLESHAQNTLLELDSNFAPRRIVHRDFDVWIDFEARKRRGLSSPFLGAEIDLGVGPPIERRYSLVYDRFVGHEFFDYLLEALKPFYEIDETAVRRRVVESFHRAFPGAARIFPETMFYFSDDPPPGHEFLLVDTKRPPEWR